jgi:hypothetical protein
MKLTVALFMLLASSSLAERPDWNHLPALVERALTKATSATLHSLSPEPVSTSRQRQDSFRNYKIVRTVRISSRAALQAVSAAIRNGVSTWDDEQYPGGFKPRYGLRINSPEGAFDFVISYETTMLVVYFGSSNTSPRPYYGIADTHKVLDDLLKVATR